MVLLLSSDYTRKRWFACMPSIMLLKYALLGLLYQERKRFKPLHRPLKSEKKRVRNNSRKVVWLSEFVTHVVSN